MMSDPSESGGSTGRADPLPSHAADAPMSEAQGTTLQALCADAGVPFDATLSTAEAARRISELQHRRDHDIEAARRARGVASVPPTSAAGEEDPGAALDEPKVKAAIQHEAHRPAGT